MAKLEVKGGGMPSRAMRPPARGPAQAVVRAPRAVRKFAPTRTIREAGSFSGRLYQISYTGQGKAEDDSTAIIKIATHGQEGKVTCKTTVAMARKISQHLSRYVRVYGTGTWVWDRQEDCWSLKEFVMADFMRLRDDETLTEFVDRIRGMTTDWPADLMDKINEFNEKN